MGLSVLIVEDQFIEANDLQRILKKAGHTVCGIAKSVEQAQKILESSTPDIVLLDIFLQGPLSGIDLAEVLSQKDVPFIFISANSDPSTFEAAKATRPHGFLIKPFRELDILLALDIANYRHQYYVERVAREAQWISGVLNNILKGAENFEQKLLLLVKAFKPFIPFDHVVIDLDLSKLSPQYSCSFHRIGFDEYAYMTAKEILDKYNLSWHDLKNSEGNVPGSTSMKYLNDDDFDKACLTNKLSSKLRDTYGLKSCLRIPLASTDKVDIILTFFSFEAIGYAKEHFELLFPLQNQMGSVIRSVIPKGNNHLNRKPTSGLPSKENNPAFSQIIGSSPKLLQALDLVHQVAPLDTSVLILGETGVGKEGLVLAIHELSDRKSKPLIKINCGAIPGNLIESELFGHERGAFTGATEKRIGKFEQAQGGTIFLDEIGEMPLDTQTKLLRVIQEKELERIGGRETVKLDIRVIAATNRNLYKEVAAGRFRIDLYYRINVFSILLSPLRERLEDIPALVDFFLQKHKNLNNGQPKKISQQALEKLMSYSWPGNVRELENIIERQIILTQSLLISSISLPEHEDVYSGDTTSDVPFKSMADIDKQHILEALRKCNGKVSGKGGAAEMLNLPSTTLVSKMKKLGIKWAFSSP